MSTGRQLALLLAHACTVLVLPAIGRGVGAAVASLAAATTRWSRAAGYEVAEALSRASDPTFLLSVALFAAAIATTAILGLIVLPLTHEHADATPEPGRDLAPVFPLATAAHRGRETSRRRAA